METIDARGLHERLERGDAIVLLDARRTEEYKREHLPGALGAMSDHIIEWAPSLVPDRDAEVVTYCRGVDCRRRLRAAERLRVARLHERHAVRGRRRGVGRRRLPAGALGAYAHASGAPSTASATSSSNPRAASRRHAAAST